MIKKDRVPDVEQLLPQATVSARNEITTELVRHYIQKKNLDRAEALLSRLADVDRYPFGAAADLVVALRPEQIADRTSVFNQSLANFEQHPNAAGFGRDDIGNFIE